MMHFPSRRPSRGFTLLEMSMVLVIIGVITGAVMIGTDVIRHARGQNAFATFVAGWSEAFVQYTRVTGGLPRDTTPPTNLIFGNANTPLCGDDLVNAFVSASIRVPKGRGVGLENEYLYQDSAGAPRVLSVCFITTNWSVRDPTLQASFVALPRHLMLLTGLTAELAVQLDVLIDGNPSARFGQFRRVGWQAALNGAQVDWPAAPPPGAPQAPLAAYLEMF